MKATMNGTTAHETANETAHVANERMTNAATVGPVNTPVNKTNKATADCCDEFDPSRPDGQAALRDKLVEVAGLSEIFKVLGDETRTRILYLLSLQEVCVCDIAEIMEMSLPAVSHHLRLLKLMRIVKYRREGKNVFYSLDDHHILGLIQLAKEHYEEDR